MSLLRQLFRLKIGEYLTEDLEEVFFPLLRLEKHPPKNLIEDIKMLWFTPGDHSDGGGCLLECLEEQCYTYSVEDYAEHYEDNCACRRAMIQLRSVARENTSEYSAVDIINIIRRLRNGELGFEIIEDDGWSTGNLDLYGINTTSLIIYKEEIMPNDKCKDNIENFLDKHMYPNLIPLDNDSGFIWLPTEFGEEDYGRLILKQEGSMNKNFWNRVGVEIE
jgi:predicted nucleotidyltransferase